MSANCTLKAHGISQNFGGLTALDDVDLEVDPGTVHGIIGPNGAGKTTFLNIVSGLQVPGRGRIIIGGRDVTGWSLDRLVREGKLARTFQTARLFTSMSVHDNVLVAAGVAVRPRSTALIRAGAAIERFGLGDYKWSPAAMLPYGVQRRVELARALATQPVLFLLDEPAAGLNATERAELGAILRQLADQGMAVVLVEHQMDLVRSACDVLTALDFGRVIAHGAVEGVLANDAVVDAYVGVARRKGGT